MIRLGLAVAAAVAALDQLSKWWMMSVVLSPPRMVPLTPFLNLTPVWNTGVSFGMLSGGGAWASWGLVALALAVSGALVVWMARVERRFLAVALGLIVGGALGNAIDRVRWAAVADFIDLHAGEAHWPAFNLADSAITVGIAILLVDSLIETRRTP